MEDTTKLQGAKETKAQTNILDKQMVKLKQQVLKQRLDKGDITRSTTVVSEKGKSNKKTSSN